MSGFRSVWRFPLSFACLWTRLFIRRGISCHLTPTPTSLPIPSSRPAVTFLSHLSSACFVTVTVAPHSESWRAQAYCAGGPRGLTAPSSEPRTKGLQSFYRQTIVGNSDCQQAGLNQGVSYAVWMGRGMPMPDLYMDRHD